MMHTEGLGGAFSGCIQRDWVGRLVAAYRGTGWGVQFLHTEGLVGSSVAAYRGTGWGGQLLHTEGLGVEFSCCIQRV